MCIRDSNSTASGQAGIRTAIANERRLELAFEGQRWFDLVRTGTVDAEMGQTITPQYHLFWSHLDGQNHQRTLFEDRRQH